MSNSETKSSITEMSNVEATDIDDDLDLIFEPDFSIFNHIKTVLCRNNPCLRGKKCSFAHNKTEIRRSICLYHFNKGCNKADSLCVHSHKHEDMIKSIIDYKKWKNPTPLPAPIVKPLAQEELVQKFGEFKISLDDESEEDELHTIVTEDEDDRKLIQMVKESKKRPYEVIQTEEFMDVPDHIKKSNPLTPAIPLEDWEIPKTSSEENPTLDHSTITIPILYTIINNQQALIINLFQNVYNLSNDVKNLSKKVKALEHKDDSDWEDSEDECGKDECGKDECDK